MDLNFINCCHHFQNLLNKNTGWTGNTWSEEKTEIELPCLITEQKTNPGGLAIGCRFLLMLLDAQLIPDRLTN